MINPQSVTYSSYGVSVEEQITSTNEIFCRANISIIHCVQEKSKPLDNVR